MVRQGEVRRGPERHGEARGVLRWHEARHSAMRHGDRRRGAER